MCDYPVICLTCGASEARPLRTGRVVGERRREKNLLFVLLYIFSPVGTSFFLRKKKRINFLVGPHPLGK